jgi:hypothetical protein
MDSASGLLRELSNHGKSVRGFVEVIDDLPEDFVLQHLRQS